jgi:hypothetical protein
MPRTLRHEGTREVNAHLSGMEELQAYLRQLYTTDDIREHANRIFRTYKHKIAPTPWPLTHRLKAPKQKPAKAALEMPARGLRT